MLVSFLVAGLVGEGTLQSILSSLSLRGLVLSNFALHIPVLWNNERSHRPLVDPVSPVRDANLVGGRRLPRWLHSKIFYDNTKESGPLRGGAHLRHPLDPPMQVMLIGGSRGDAASTCPPPPNTQILSFLHTTFLQHRCIGPWPPPLWGQRPLQEILDAPLMLTYFL